MQLIRLVAILCLLMFASGCRDQRTCLLEPLLKPAGGRDFNSIP